MTHCPHCGAETEAETAGAQSVCAGCGALLGGVWPPAVTAEPPEAGPGRMRLLTGRGWRDGLLGVGAWWLLLFGLNYFSSFVISLFLIHDARLGQSQPPVPEYVIWTAIAVPTLLAYTGAYFGMRVLSSRMAREFGQMSLWGLCSIPFFLLLLWWAH